MRYYLAHFFGEMTVGVQDWKQRPQRKLLNRHHPKGYSLGETGGRGGGEM